MRNSCWKRGGNHHLDLLRFGGPHTKKELLHILRDFSRTGTYPVSITRVVSVGGLELSNITTSSVSAVRRRFAARLRKERTDCVLPRIKAFSLPGRHRSRSVSVAPWAWAIGTHETERSEF